MGQHRFGEEGIRGSEQLLIQSDLNHDPGVGLPVRGEAPAQASFTAASIAAPVGTASTPVKSRSSEN
jgi:hypothetical protein